MNMHNNRPIFYGGSKSEANQLQSAAKANEGGVWEVKHYGPKNWVIICTQTKAELEEEKAIQSAKFWLNPEYNWFDGTFRSFTLKGAKASQQAILDKFTEEFTKDPHYTMRWADKVVLATAELYVINTILHYRGLGASDEAICRTLEDEVKRRVKQIASSSSQMSNICENAERVAYAKYAESLRSWMNHREQAVLTLSQDCYY